MFGEDTWEIVEDDTKWNITMRQAPSYSDYIGNIYVLSDGVDQMYTEAGSSQLFTRQSYDVTE